MIEINVYQPGKIDFIFQLPSSWNDLTHEEVIFVAKTLLNRQEDTGTEIQPMILKFLIENRIAKNILPEAWYLQLDLDQVYCQVLPHLDFIFKTNDLTNTPPPVTFSPSGAGGGSFYPITFETITCGEYEDCDVFSNKFLQSDSKEDLANLAAILFRPLKRFSPPSGGRGVEVVPYMVYNYRTDSYQPYQASKKAKHFMKLPPEQLYAIFIWFSGCRNQLAGMFPDVYDGPGSTEPDLMAFTKCIHSGAGTKNGSREKIRVTRLYEFMFEMDQESAAAKKLEEQYQQMNKT